MSGSAELNEFLKFVCTTVPRYQGLPERLELLPTSSKLDYRENYEAYLAQTDKHSRELIVGLLRSKERPCDAEEEVGSGIVIENTSGSSGIPFRVVKTRAERMQIAACMWGARRKLDPLVSIKNYLPLINVPRRLRWTHQIPADDQQAVDLWEGMEAQGVRWIHASTELLIRFASSLTNANRVSKGTIKYIEYTGQALGEDDRILIESVLNAQTVNQYGMREVWMVGAGLRNSPLEILDKSVVVELLDNDNMPTSNEQYGRIVVTSKLLRLMPIVRYNTGDWGRWVNIAGRRLLELQPHRKSTLIAGSVTERPGGPIFKSLLKQLAGQFSLNELKDIKIRQTKADQFQICVVGALDEVGCTRWMESKFNEMAVLPYYCTFQVVHMGADSLEYLRRVGKGGVFSTDCLVNAD